MSLVHAHTSPSTASVSGPGIHPPDHYESFTDVAVVSAAKNGEYLAFEELVRRFHARIYRLVMGMLKDPTDAEEVVQEIFLSVFRHLQHFKGQSSPGSWIYRIAVNTALMRLRRNRRKPFVSLDALPVGVSDAETATLWPPGEWSQKPEDALLSRELGERIEAAIARLPEKYRLVLLLRDIDGQNNEEVAATLGLTLPTVKARLHRSRLFIRSELERYFANK